MGGRAWEEERIVTFFFIFLFFYSFILIIYMQLALFLFFMAEKRRIVLWQSDANKEMKFSKWVVGILTVNVM